MTTVLKFFLDVSDSGTTRFLLPNIFHYFYLRKVHESTIFLCALSDHCFLILLLKMVKLFTFVILIVRLKIHVESHPLFFYFKKILNFIFFSCRLILQEDALHMLFRNKRNRDKVWSRISQGNTKIKRRVRLSIYDQGVIMSSHIMEKIVIGKI